MAITQAMCTSFKKKPNTPNTPPAIKEQAKQFKAVITNVIFQYIQLAKKEERATIVNKVLQTGNNELSEIIRRL